jgi:hypothetical protein
LGEHEDKKEKSAACAQGRRLTPRFSGGALTYMPWHFIRHRPLQLLVSRWHAANGDQSITLHAKYGRDI